MTKPRATDYGCPECHHDTVLVDRDDRLCICVRCGWSGLVVEEASARAEHVCGLQGFGRGVDGANDTCPACAASALPADTPTETAP